MVERQVEPDRVERVGDATPGLVARHAEVLAAERDVVADAREDHLRVGILQHETGAAARVGRLPLFGVALVVFAAFLGLARLVTAWEGPYRRLARNGFARDLLRQAVRLVIAGAGLVLALEILDATTVVAAAAGLAGLATLALSLAFRDLAENYIASVLLSIRQPFLPHDHVLIAGHEGRVVRLTSRATVLIDLAGNHVRIPNSMVFKSVIVNYTRNPVRRFDFTVGVSPQSDLGDAIALGVRTLCRMPGTVAEPPAQGWIDMLGDWNVVLHFFAWIDQREADWFRTRSEGVRLVKEAFDAAGIEMPEPTLQLERTEARPERAATDGGAAEPEPELELDISPDPHLDRAVAEGRAGGEADLLDPSAARE